MTFQFPSDKTDFVGENGIGYTYVDGRWRVKNYKTTEQDLSGYLKKPYTVYVGDSPPAESISEDKSFKEGELYYSTLTLELFCHDGISNWWPTAADYSGEIQAISSELKTLAQTVTGNEGEIDDLQIALGDRLNRSGDQVTGYLDFNSDSDSAGSRYHAQGKKAFSIWPYKSVPGQIRGRVEEDSSLNFTGYLGGKESRFLYWSGADDNPGLRLHSLVDPLDDGSAISKGWANGQYLKAAGNNEYRGQFTVAGKDSRFYCRNDAGDTTLTIFPETGGITIDGGYLKLRTGGSDVFSVSKTGACEIARVGDEKRGFTINGRLEADKSIGKLLNVYHNGPGVSDAVNYAGRTSEPQNIQTKQSVEDLIASGGGGSPVGAVMIWLGNSAPAGWLMLRGGSFDTGKYPKLHQVLGESQGYKSGKLPDFRGYYPGGAGDGPGQLTPDKAGYQHAFKTAMPSGGAPKSKNNIPDGGVRQTTKSGSANFYSASESQVEIAEGWDAVTRPPTLSVHFIIKHD